MDQKGGGGMRITKGMGVRKTTLGTFVRGWQGSRFADSPTPLYVFRWRSLMIVWGNDRPQRLAEKPIAEHKKV